MGAVQAILVLPPEHWQEQALGDYIREQGGRKAVLVQVLGESNDIFYLSVGLLLVKEVDLHSVTDSPEHLHNQEAGEHGQADEREHDQGCTEGGQQDSLE